MKGSFQPVLQPKANKGICKGCQTLLCDHIYVCIPCWNILFILMCSEHSGDCALFLAMKTHEQERSMKATYMSVQHFPWFWPQEWTRHGYLCLSPLSCNSKIRAAVELFWGIHFLQVLQCMCTQFIIANILSPVQYHTDLYRYNTGKYFYLCLAHKHDMSYCVWQIEWLDWG